MDLTAGSSTTAVDASQTAQANGTHRRTYQACVSFPPICSPPAFRRESEQLSHPLLLIPTSNQIPCRKRKVRCDLGPVDDPHEPPCQRCRRESKECYFSATRRKRRASSGEDEIRDGEDLADEPAAYNVRRKGARVSAPFQAGQTVMQDGVQPTHPGSISTGSPLDGYSYGPPGQPRPSSQYAIDQTPSGKADDGQDQELTNEAAAALFQSPINTPGDALHLLLQASGQSEVMHRQSMTDKVAPLDPSQASVFPPGVNQIPSERGRTTQQPGSGTSAGNIDPAIAGNGVERDALPTAKADLLVWSRLRFVRAGWFTAKEAVSYIN